MALLIPVLAAFLVRGHFISIRTTWPNSYFSLDDDSGIDPLAQRSVARFALWRLAPVFVAALGGIISAERLGAHAAAAAAIFVIAHVTLSTAPSVRVHLTGRRNRRKPRVGVLIQLVTLLFVAAIAGLVCVFQDNLEGLVPPPEAMLEAGWVAILLAAGSGLFLSFQDGIDRGAVALDVSRSEISETLLDDARRVAISEGADPRLVEAILLVENLQRPKWVRWLERRKALLLPDGTYGVMQVENRGPLADQQSIQEAVRRHLRGAQIPARTHQGQKRIDAAAAVEAIQSYNSSAAWRNAVQRALEHLCPPEGYVNQGQQWGTFGSSRVWELDGNPELQVIDVKFGGPFLASTLTVPSGPPRQLQLALLDEGGRTLWVESRTMQGEPSNGGRSSLQVCVPGHEHGVALLASVKSTDIDAMCRVDIPRSWRDSISRALAQSR